jgi:hypothetical protein
MSGIYLQILHNNWPGSKQIRVSRIRCRVCFPQPQMLQDFSYAIRIVDEDDGFYIRALPWSVQRVCFTDLVQYVTNLEVPICSSHGRLQFLATALNGAG